MKMDLWCLWLFISLTLRTSSIFCLNYVQATQDARKFSLICIFWLYWIILASYNVDYSQLISSFACYQFNLVNHGTLQNIFDTFNVQCLEKVFSKHCTILTFKSYFWSIMSKMFLIFSPSSMENQIKIPQCWNLKTCTFIWQPSQ